MPPGAAPVAEDTFWVPSIAGGSTCAMTGAAQTNSEQANSINEAFMWGGVLRPRVTCRGGV